MLRRERPLSIAVAFLLLPVFTGTPARSQSSCGCEVKVSNRDPRTGRPGRYFDCVRRDGETFTQWAKIKYYPDGSFDKYLTYEFPKRCVAKDLMDKDFNGLMDTLASRADSLRKILGYDNKSILENAVTSKNKDAFKDYSFKEFSYSDKPDKLKQPQGILSDEEISQLRTFATDMKESKGYKKIYYTASVTAPSGTSYTASGVCASKNLPGQSSFLPGSSVRKITVKGIGRDMKELKLQLDTANTFVLVNLTTGTNSPCPFEWDTDSINKFSADIRSDKYGLDEYLK